LIEKGFAYPDPYTAEELESFRTKAEDEKRPFLFRDHRPEKTEAWDGQKSLRFKVPEIKRYEWEDMVRGTLSAGEEALDDFILIKGDGYPTYNFSHIIDDLEMGVTHIIRGEEFISSTPKFLSLYDALGIEYPIFATMPAILGPDGKKKLSKRDGAKDILDYRSEGYLPEALVNFLALLGWHPSDDTEVMSVKELLVKFDLSRVQKGGAKFDEEKLLWLNREHLKALTDAEFASRFKELFGQDIDARLVPLVKERGHTLAEAKALLSEYDFMSDVSYDPSLLLQGGKISREVATNHLRHTMQMLENVPDEGFSAAQLKDIIWPYATSQGRGDVLWPLRAALSGKEKSPDPFIVAELLGKTETLERIAEAIKSL
jgi:glutamyl-tRNA synthetase